MELARESDELLMQHVSVGRREHYWQVNHHRMTKPAFEDGAGVFSSWRLVKCNPLGDTKVYTHGSGELEEKT